MKELNVDFLINTSVEELIENSASIFKKLLQEIKLYLNLDMVFFEVKIKFIEDPEDLSIEFIDFGVKKTLENKTLIISVFNRYKRFLKIIFLRLAYKCFIPIELQDNEIINIFINEKVEIDLQDSDFIEDWKVQRRKSVITYEFMDAEFDRLEKFLKQVGKENQPSPFQYFFLYIRKNVDLISNLKKDLSGSKRFYDLIFQEYVQIYTEYTDEILETIRIITEIFYKVKSYRSVLDYQHYFKEFKEMGLIQTTLSQRKFTENMHWIKNFTYLAPNYYINWLTLDVISTLCILKFHPVIETGKIIKIISQIPFFLFPRYSRNNFGIEIRGFFLFPKSYLNDVIHFLEKMESEGFLTEKKLFLLSNLNYTTNLNYFRNSLRRGIVIDPDKRDYKTDFEMEFKMDYGQGEFKLNVSLFDWLLIDRSRQVSVTGLGFERKKEILNTLKSDLLNETQSQSRMISEIKRDLNEIHNSSILRKKIIELIDSNKYYGFFYIKQMLNDYIVIFEFIKSICSENPSIKNLFQFQEFIDKKGISKVIEDNIVLGKLKINTLREFVSLFFESKRDFEKSIEQYGVFYNVFKSFYNLRLFNLESIKSIINDHTLIKKIFQSKEEKLRKSYEGYKLYKITNRALEQRLEDFLNNKPPVIHPSLLGSFLISHDTKYYLISILKDTIETRENVKKVKWFFPRIVYYFQTLDYKTKEKYIYLQLQMPNLHSKEKQLLFSILFNIFHDNLISLKSYCMSGFQEAFSRKDFYDLEREDFFYTKDLFEQFYLYIQSTIKSEIDPISESYSEITRDLWGKQRYLSHLINQVENRISKEHIDLSLIILNRLLIYHNNLKKKLMDVEKFKHSKIENFFKNYIKTIKFIPSFQFFGFGQYFLYFYPLDLNEIDFKHLLHNSFQKIKYPANIDNSNSFYIKFIWPYRNPNVSLINWLTKSKRVIREYCLFFIKKVFQIFHFNYNLSVNEWDLDPNRFKIYFQNVLFNPEYKLTIPELKEFNIGDLNISNYFTPESPEFEALTQIYNWKSIDIKSYLGTRNYTIIKHITELLEKNLIYPFISVKNLNLIEKVYIILPDLNKENNEKILKIFSFFNIGFIYEIEGEYYISGFTEEIKFENGLMIKLYLPDCQLDEFEKLFDLIFEYLGIKHYVVLNDLVDGKNFLKSIYGNLDFLKSYNPLKNLIWNDKDKIWMNHKLFDGKFRKIYHGF